jgi:hypothetical protein
LEECLIFSTANPSALGLLRAWRFLKSHVTAIAAISLLLIVPCVWHQHIEAGDLGSHVYNAWLAQLIEKGQAPGLYLARQWNNILADLLLLRVGDVVGFAVAETIVASVSVLAFFWGVFILILRMTERPPWMLTPCIAMLAYGYSFNMGFLNYYLSIGLACFALGAVWRGGVGNWILGIVLAPIVLLALWFVATVFYVVLWRTFPGYWRMVLPIAVISGYDALRLFFARTTQFYADWRPDPFYWMNGTDQLSLYGHRYEVLSRGALAWGVICFAFALVKTLRSDPGVLKALRLPAELYLIALAASAFVPENIHSDIYAGWIGLLVSRLTLITAIFGLSVLCALPLQKWHGAGFGLLAAGFFVFLYQDTAKVARIEARAETLITKLAYGTRVVPVVNAPADWRIQFIAHSVERACIGRCFSYSNYEPSSGQFRVRAEPGSELVTDSSEKSEDMASGDYVVKPEDLPLVSIYQCDEADWTKLCAVPLKVGQKTEAPDSAPEQGQTEK